MGLLSKNLLRPWHAPINKAIGPALKCGQIAIFSLVYNILIANTWIPSYLLWIPQTELPYAQCVALSGNSELPINQVFTLNVLVINI